MCFVFTFKVQLSLVLIALSDRKIGRISAEISLHPYKKWYHMLNRPILNYVASKTVVNNLANNCWFHPQCNFWSLRLNCIHYINVYSALISERKWRMRICILRIQGFFDFAHLKCTKTVVIQRKSRYPNACNSHTYALHYQNVVKSNLSVTLKSQTPISKKAFSRLWHEKHHAKINKKVFSCHENRLEG